MKKILGLSLMATSIIMVGCGGSTTTASTNTLAKITGTVPGTLIEAYCENNYYARVTSTNNGTNKHPFSIAVPQNSACSLVMTTNQNNPTNRVITPISFGNGNKTIKVGANLNLGNIPLPTSYAQIKADDRDSNHIPDSEFDIDPKGATTVPNAVDDKNGNGIVDNYDDKDNNGVVDAYDDKDGNGTPDLYDDNNGNGLPDVMDNGGSQTNRGNEGSQTNRGNEGSQTNRGNEGSGTNNAN